ncbi:SdpI/YhfL family protein [Chitinophaga skermanii]|uniref:SdpI/YhfL family protein n=1 Tax=Chitinophaga skermanii TaxID=331697 RepID=A0A327QL80_9BACT|nr:SdpI family protein [Chitinophaga skermanii]RAJ02507.1 SdpI/YhfL family protein [Chitinophaga skermanii]
MTAFFHSPFFNASLIAGPLIFLMAWVFQKFPPRTMNAWYGYRSYLSMHSPEMWKEANRYIAVLAKYLSWILTPWGLLAALLFSTQTDLFYYFTIAPVVIGILYICGSTEYHIHQMLKPGEDELKGGASTDFPN